MNIKTDELRDVQKYIVKTLVRLKMFDKYRFNGYFQLLFDGTGLSNHDYNLNNNCLKRKHKDGKISYYKYILECKLVVGKIVISIDSEFIENSEILNKVNIPNYFLSTNIKYKEHNLNVFKYIEAKNKKTTTFRYISNLSVNNENIEEIVTIGRRRWKIENEGFILKNIELST